MGVCDRTFRRYLERFHEAGVEGLIDKRLSQVSQRRAPVDEVMATVGLYRSRYRGWNVKHFYAWYCRDHAGLRSYTWVKNTLQAEGVVSRAPKRGAHRKRRERSPLPGTDCSVRFTRIVAGTQGTYPQRVARWTRSTPLSLAGH